MESEMQLTLKDINEEVRKIWVDILNIEDIKNDDDFFDLGGSSFQVFQVLIRIKNMFLVELPLAFFLGMPILSKISEEIYNKVND